MVKGRRGRGKHLGSYKYGDMLQDTRGRLLLGKVASEFKTNTIFLLLCSVLEPGF